MSVLPAGWGQAGAARIREDDFAFGSADYRDDQATTNGRAVYPEKARATYGQIVDREWQDPQATRCHRTANATTPDRVRAGQGLFSEVVAGARFELA